MIVSRKAHTVLLVGGLAAMIGLTAWWHPARARSLTVPRQVLAYYYAWWGTPQFSGRWIHWENVDPAQHTIASSRFYPADGPYDSRDPKQTEREAAEAERAGITGWVYSWWGPGSVPDQALPIALEAAARHHLKVAVAIEQLIENGQKTRDQEQNRHLAATMLDTVLSKYASHPAYLHVGNRPVVFLNRVALHQIPLDAWAQVRAEAARSTGITPFFAGDGPRDQTRELAVTDALYNYETAALTANQSVTQLRSWAGSYYHERMRSVGDRVSIAVILPQHDASELASRPDARNHVTDRHDGQALAILWEAAIAANPDWVLIVSWNEWHEGSQLEPSREFGDSALDENARFARRFLAMPPRSHPEP